MRVTKGDTRSLDYSSNILVVVELKFRLKRGSICIFAKGS